MVDPTQDELIRGYLRYEIVRKLAPHEFTRLWQLSLESGRPFDDLVDDIVEMKKYEMA